MNYYKKPEHGYGLYLGFIGLPVYKLIKIRGKI